MKRGNTDAETCRLNGWGVGTVLTGDEGYGPETIVITAVGEDRVLAKLIKDREGSIVERCEGNWTLCYRDWAEGK